MMNKELEDAMSQYLDAVSETRLWEQSATTYRASVEGALQNAKATRQKAADYLDMVQQLLK